MGVDGVFGPAFTLGAGGEGADHGWGIIGCVDGWGFAIGELREGENLAGHNARTSGVVMNDGLGGEGWGEGEQVRGYLLHDR